jgi:hypothetical protein
MGDKAYPDPGQDSVTVFGPGGPQQQLTGNDFSSHQGELELKAVYRFGTT